jgi:hypothetical protein
LHYNPCPPEAELAKYKPNRPNKFVVPRESFTPDVPGLACPLCLSRHYLLIAKRDPGRGLLQSIYRCEGCRSYFGDARELEAEDGPGAS